MSASLASFTFFLPLPLPQIPALVSLSLLGEEFLEKDIAIALCSLLLNESGAAGAMGKGQKNILDMGALGALNALARSDEEELQARAVSPAAFRACGILLFSPLLHRAGVIFRSLVLFYFCTLLVSFSGSLRARLPFSSPVLFFLPSLPPLLLLSLSFSLSYVPHPHLAFSSPQIKAANTLADLTVDRSVGQKLVDAGGINTLVELCNRDNGLIMQYTAVAIGNLSSSSKKWVLFLFRSSSCCCPLLTRSPAFPPASPTCLSITISHPPFPWISLCLF